MHPPICMSSIDHSHVGTATDVQWLSSVAFSKEGATAQQVTPNSTNVRIAGASLVFCTPIPGRSSSPCGMHSWQRVLLQSRCETSSRRCYQLNTLLPCGQGGTDDKLQTSYIASTALDGKVLFWDCTYALSYEGYLLQLSVHLPCTWHAHEQDRHVPSTGIVLKLGCACREGDIESPWKPVCIIALRALEVETLGLACTRISFANPASSLKLLASSLLGDIISCSYSAAETEVPPLTAELTACGPVHCVRKACISCRAPWQRPMSDRSGSYEISA